MISFDLGNLLVNLWRVWKQDREWQAWLKLLLSTFYSGFIALTGTTGLALQQHVSVTVAIGMGLVACAVSVLGVLLVSPQGRGLVLSLPQPVVKEYQAPEGPTIIRPTK